MPEKNPVANHKPNKTLRQERIDELLKKETLELKRQFAERLLKLVTSGFGLVSALAWNEVIKEFIRRFIEPIFGGKSGLVSLFIYALTVTFLAVFITYQLSKFTTSERE